MEGSQHVLGRQGVELEKDRRVDIFEELLVALDEVSGVAVDPMQQELERLGVILRQLEHADPCLFEPVAESDLEEARVGGLEDFFVDRELGGR